MAVFSVSNLFFGLFARTVIPVLICSISTDAASNLSSATEADATHRLEHGLYLGELYRWADAAPDFREAEAEFVRSGDQRNAFYARLGLLRATIEQHNLPRTSADLARQVETSGLLQSDKQLRMFCLIVKGDIDEEIDVRSGRRDWEQVEALASQLGDQRWQNRALAQIGIAAFYDRDLETARKNVGTAVEVATKIHDVGAQVRFTTVLGRALIEAKMYDQAIAYFAQALQLAKQNPDLGYPFFTQEAQIEAVIGLKQYDEAQHLVDVFIQESSRKYTTSAPQAEILPIAARIAMARGNVQLAIDDLRRSIAICKAGGYQQSEAQPEAMLSEIYRGRGDLVQAEHFAAEAARTSQLSGDRWALPERLRTLAQIQELRGEYMQADRTYQKAGDFIDTGLANSSSVLEKTALINASGSLFPEHFALVTTRLRNTDRAYSILEQVRGRVTADLLMSGSANSPNAKEIERKIATLQLQMTSARSSGDVTRLRDQIFLTEEMRWITPGVSILKHKTQEVVPLERIRGSLDSSTAVLEYVLAEPHSYCLVITRGNAIIVPLPGEAHIDLLAAAYLEAARSRLPAHVEATRLYEALLKPLAAIQDKTRLVIVPDGQLHRIPFEALEDPSGAYVLDTHVVAYAPSATALYLLARDSDRSTTSMRPLLGVGGIPYAGTKYRVIGFSEQDGLEAIKDLNYSKQEILSASAALGGHNNNLLLGQDATEAAFKRGVQRQHGTIHIAAHVIAKDPNPDNAAIILLPDPAAGEDGLLHATEIATMHLNANLAVLSACDTAAGPIQGEEGISTLASSFLLAGAKSVVSTLWSADDSSSLFVMQQFYSRVASGENAAVALTDAKRQMLKTFGRSAALPFYWAGFKYEGPVTSPSLQPQETE
jgi:CHAT domain-containing protein